MATASIHPFPARMAPELAERFLDRLAAGSVVLDPMMGSGSFPLAASQRGHHAIGYDTDPLAVLIAQTAASEIDENELRAAAYEVANGSQTGDYKEFPTDEETRSFIDFWFDPHTRDGLAGLSIGIRKMPMHLRPALWCGFSRLIITKDDGASRARDVSHSRPHRVRDVASFDVRERFPLAVATVARRNAIIRERPSEFLTVPERPASLFRADGRTMPLASNCVDAVMTSPPYLVAIDYLRGHRMSLVWMGYSIEYLRGLRSSNIGSQKGEAADQHIERMQQLATSGLLETPQRRLINRYIIDMRGIISEICRVLRPNGAAAFVIADARLKGTSVSVEKIVTELAVAENLKLSGRLCREIPANRRYLPPPRQSGKGLDLRMREEVVLEFTG